MAEVPVRDATYQPLEIAVAGQPRAAPIGASWTRCPPSGCAQIAGSPAGEASTKKRSALLTLYVEPPTTAARGTTERHIGCTPASGHCLRPSPENV